MRTSLRDYTRVASAPLGAEAGLGSTIKKGLEQMGDHFDELSKAFARGASRRAALKRFATGVAGALVASVLPSLSGEAQSAGNECRVSCSALPQGKAFSRCVAECTVCRQHGRSFVVLNSSPICV